MPLYKLYKALQKAVLWNEEYKSIVDNFASDPAWVMQAKAALYDAKDIVDNPPVYQGEAAKGPKRIESPDIVEKWLEAYNKKQDIEKAESKARAKEDAKAVTAYIEPRKTKNDK